MREFFKGSLVIFAFKVAGAASTLLYTILLSRFYGVGVLGTFHLVLTLLMFLSIFNKIGLDIYLIRKIPEFDADGDHVRSLIRRAIAAVLVASVVVGLAILIAAPWLDSRLFPAVDAGEYLRWLGVALAFYSLLMVLSSAYRGFSDLVRFAFFQNLYVQGVVLGVLAIFAFGVQSQPDAVIVLYAVVITGAVLSFVSMELLLRNRYDAGLLTPVAAPFRGPLVKEAYPLSVTSTAIFVISYLSTFFISYFHGVDAVGRFGAIVRLSIPLVFFSTAVSSYIAPRLARRWVAGDLDGVRSSYRRAVKTLTLTGAPVLLVLCVFPGFFLGLFGPEFRDEKVAFIVYNISVFAGASLFGPIGYVLAMTDRQRLFQWLMLGAMLLALVLNFLLVPPFGILGAAWATLIATVAWKLSGYLFLRKAGLA